MCNTAELLTWNVVFAVEFLVIIAGNIITIIVFWKLRFVLKRTYYLLINLTIADLTVGLGVVKIVTSNMLKLETTEDTRWAKFIAMDVFSGTASLTSLLLVAVERFYAIVFPFRHRILTKRIYMKCIAGVWMTSVLITAITLMPDFFFNSGLAGISRWTLASFTIFCLIVICCLYTTIWVFARKENPGIPRDKREQNKRLAKTLFIITVLTLIAWIPLAVAIVFPHDVTRHGDCVIPSALFAGLFLQLANSALNPAVYCYRMPEFTKTLKQDVLRCRSGNTKANAQSVIGRSSTDLPEFHSVANLPEGPVIKLS
ncbi:hypothetical protein OS493_004691 [Desmophyllum pertusum]|uniref:G-protein coupled receptors family 1 profile domain-containing protein n=1 Tax=Desmophyllum pertusum TaxID=174260 RepID=A0A9W9ZG31_9CNID|nr:hypothetical protein OS493_004691 [Desmophyllum pertusum]